MSTPLPADIKTAFDILHAKLAGEWAALKTTLQAAGWLSFSPSSLSAAFQFLLAAADQLTGLADSSGMVNEQKKAVVVQYVITLYETVVAAELPTVALPIAKTLEPEIAAMLGGAIEYIVAKLHGKPAAPLPVPAPPAKP